MEPSEMAMLVEQLADTRARQANLKAIGDALAARIREAMGDTEHATFGRLQVTCKRSRRFSPELARTLLTPDVLSAITVTVDEISDALAKEKLTGAAYESCKEPFGEPRLTFTRAAEA